MQQQKQQGLKSQVYTIKRISLIVEVEHYDPKTGKVTGVDVCDPHIMYEADFPEGLSSYLRSKGLAPKPFAPPVEAKEERNTSGL